MFFLNAQSKISKISNLKILHAQTSYTIICPIQM